MKYSTDPFVHLLSEELLKCATNEDGPFVGQLYTALEELLSGSDKSYDTVKSP
jgi:hypothetical protein